jgi:hypothetical protein
MANFSALGSYAKKIVDERSCLEKTTLEMVEYWGQVRIAGVCND